MEWISVNDRLPENETPCMIYAYDNVLFGIYIDGEFEHISYDQSPEYVNPSKWMPLPEPPKES